MSIGTFLADENFGSWADEMEDMPLPAAPEPRSTYGGERRAISSTAGFGNGFNDRERPAFSSRPELPLPTEPPFTAHIGNLSFDATSSDVSQLFADCEVTNVRIVEDKLNRSPKGFGYVEFATVEGLKKALTFSGTTLQGRAIRVSIAEPPKDSGSSRDFSDWSRKGPLPDLPRRESNRSFNRDFPDNVSESGSTRGGRRFESDGKVRDFGNWERKGPLSPVAAVAGREGGRPRSNEGSNFRKNSPAWGEGRSQDGSRPPRREFQERPERPERTPTAAEMDNQWRARMRPDPPAPKEPSAPSSPVPTPAAPAVRPKLNLQKRTVSENVQSPPPSATGDSKASPFGAARPIDTAAREQEVVAKRERARKEAEEKAKAEKAEKQRQSKEKAKAEKSATGDSNGTKETDPDAPKKSNFEVLRRAADEDGGENEAEESKEESTAAKEQPKEAADSKTNGSWRKAEPAAAEADEEGWSTVSTNKRNKGRGRY
ncbi:translation initiation factor 4B [Talaromyces stipitatus ATCC 10500]|uniref:Translation initiation factor 4B n=1 Tax=Talaromyces stipitatus (strain ATCC 10500 / CBS 375.48 / QM 6759 / NRRL 1006) TaxID=441959 RepID=B8LXZ9_TALSN|nr:translation initiation factor 4B [Talaromyces stipitatus ATCC 10500]EED22814.1 translation initiation factor 4B [Talaromyces stipitatus ATCC 10500]